LINHLSFFFYVPGDRTFLKDSLDVCPKPLPLPLSLIPSLFADLNLLPFPPLKEQRLFEHRIIWSPPPPLLPTFVAGRIGSISVFKIPLVKESSFPEYSSRPFSLDPTISFVSPTSSLWNDFPLSFGAGFRCRPDPFIPPIFGFFCRDHIWRLRATFSPKNTRSCAIPVIVRIEGRPPNIFAFKDGGRVGSRCPRFSSFPSSLFFLRVSFPNSTLPSVTG